MALRPFRFGVINERMGTRQAWMTFARAVEDLGFATFLIRDHLVPDFFGDQFAPVAALTTAANATATLRVGSLVLANDFRHPAVLAKEAATLDLLSDGRLELGLGAGWLRSEYERSGIQFDPPGVRIARLEESLCILKGLFAPGPFSFSGAHYTVADLDGFPKPVQRPHPPILVLGGGRRVLTLAGREANTVGVLTTSVASGSLEDDPWGRLSASVAEKIAWVRHGAGPRFDEIELSLVITVLVTHGRRRRTEQFIRERRWSGVDVEHVWDMPSVFIGSVEQIVDDMLARREQLGFSYFVVADEDVAAFAPIVARLAGK